MNIGEQIKKYRLEAKLSQRELGERLGISQQQIAQYENGKRIPKIETINNIAGALGVGVRRLYPDFSMDEWRQTNTYRESKKRYDTAIRGIVAILSYEYPDIEEEVFDGESFYTITIDGEKHDLKYATLNSLLHCLTGVIPSLYELVKEIQQEPPEE